MKYVRGQAFSPLVAVKVDGQVTASIKDIDCAITRNWQSIADAHVNAEEMLQSCGSRVRHAWSPCYGAACAGG
eukprot:2643076-Amphidinium_carterae.1